MESKNRGIKPQASPRITQSANHGGHMRPEIGRNQRDLFSNPNHHLQLQPGPFHPPGPTLYSRNMVHEEIQRDMEKQRIREEIIMSEIARRRELEAEVRRELMIERELALRQTGSNMFPFGVSPVMGFDPLLRLPFPNISMEEKITLSIDKRESRVSKGFESVPFQRGTSDLRISEVEPVLEGAVEKKKIILLDKPGANTSGSKRKAETTPIVDANEPPSDLIMKKKAKEEWSCAICQISATSEQGLKDHLRGKKHRSKKAALITNRAGKNYSIGFFQKKATQPAQIASESLKNEPETFEKGEKNGDPKEKMYKFWCDMCRMGAHSRKVMNNHKRGKKHLSRLLKQGKIGVPEEVGEGGKGVICENVEEILGGAGLEDHEPVDATKPEDSETACETKAQECRAVDLSKSEDDSTREIVFLNQAEDEKKATLENVVENLDELRSEYCVPENGNGTEDEVARDMSKLEPVDGTKAENGDDGMDGTEPKAQR